MFFVAEIGMDVVSLFTDYTWLSPANSGDFSGHSRRASIFVKPRCRTFTYVYHSFGVPSSRAGLLHFSEAICQNIHGGGSANELLSLPYSYPNYFCDTPPWHGYVQTFFDISTRASIKQMMRERNTAPPQWIVYQRQLHILDGAERLYNHGQPLAQRDLDMMILRKIADREWRLVDKRDYLEGDGWYVIQTRPWSPLVHFLA